MTLKKTFAFAQHCDCSFKFAVSPEKHQLSLDLPNLGGFSVDWAFNFFQPSRNMGYTVVNRKGKILMDLKDNFHILPECMKENNL